MPACPYLPISRYKNTNHKFHISIELLLMFLIQKSLSLIFSKQYCQVLLNEDENLKCLKSETKEKMKNNYLYRCYYIYSKDSFLFIVCWIQQGDSKYVTKSCVVYIIIVIRNGKMVWKVIWIEYYLRLNLSSRRH